VRLKNSVHHCLVALRGHITNDRAVWLMLIMMFKEVALVPGLLSVDFSLSFFGPRVVHILMAFMSDVASA
jgi:hypothetical protein